MTNSTKMLTLIPFADIPVGTAFIEAGSGYMEEDEINASPCALFDDGPHLFRSGNDVLLLQSNLPEFLPFPEGGYKTESDTTGLYSIRVKRPGVTTLKEQYTADHNWWYARGELPFITDEMWEMLMRGPNFEKMMARHLGQSLDLAQSLDLGNAPDLLSEAPDLGGSLDVQ